MDTHARAPQSTRVEPGTELISLTLTSLSGARLATPDGTQKLFTVVCKSNPGRGQRTTKRYKVIATAAARKTSALSPVSSLYPTQFFYFVFQLIIYFD